MTVILDYGMGNLRSVEKAVQAVGGDCRVQTDLAGADRVILPGVGAFAAAMERLAPLRGGLVDWIASDRPFLGICLGMQLLCERSDELGGAEGLGVLPGEVRYLPKLPGLKVPHMGWNALEPVGEGMGVVPGEQAYFVHSLFVDTAEESLVAAWSEHGIRFPAALRRGRLWATQFHPEKSGDVGLRILSRFLSSS